MWHITALWCSTFAPLHAAHFTPKRTPTQTLGVKQMINPWLTNSMIDSCAFDPKQSPEQQAAEELAKLWQEHSLPLLIAHSTKKELEHPNTPLWVKKEAEARIYSVETDRTPSEFAVFRNIHEILTGEGNPENHIQDAEHVFEASKYGSYFITTDRRILSKKYRISKVSNATVLLPSTFVELVKRYEA